MFDSALENDLEADLSTSEDGKFLPLNLVFLGRKKISFNCDKRLVNESGEKLLVETIVFPYLHVLTKAGFPGLF